MTSRWVKSLRGAVTFVAISVALVTGVADADVIGTAAASRDAAVKAIAATQQDALVAGDKLREKNGRCIICTIILIQNETGHDLKLGTSKDWAGHIGTVAFPATLHAGQTGVVLHVHTSGTPTGSVGAVVYTLTGSDGKSYDVALAWSTRYSGSNATRTTIQAAGAPWDWSSIENNMTSDYSRASNTGASSTSTTGPGSSPVAVFNISVPK